MKATTMIWVMMSVIITLTGCSSASEVKESAVYQSISPEEAFQRLENEEQITLLDVRTESEFEEGHIPGSILIPLQVLEEEALLQLSDKDAPIFIYCRSGRRSLEAAEIMLELGYTRIYDLGGILDWPYDVVK
ncbi:rhodanese-like domain-containing protein [Anoxynatronum buryatiense]|uniref:Rhodanese-related sulfurtransferase n=1 Tax=Anoxynatronum buryatiense TaxID=489973 RepID=A0AA45WYK6_9CLOT|nr:rhodanese-like domain-containing protein [Anoxynatronum buryatiense]SMP69303.1 Rhodanese-related sulfurtransferase [Anoxynatronum buryatiense]